MNSHAERFLFDNNKVKGYKMLELTELEIKEILSRINEEELFKLYPEYNHIFNVFRKYTGLIYIILGNSEKTQYLHTPIKRVMKEISECKRMSIDNARTFLNIGVDETEYMVTVTDKRKEIDNETKCNILKLYPGLTYIYGPYKDNIYKGGKYVIQDTLYMYNRNSYNKKTFGKHGKDHKPLRIPLAIIREELSLGRRITDDEIDKLLVEYTYDIIPTTSDYNTKLSSLIDVKVLKKFNPICNQMRSISVNVGWRKPEISIATNSNGTVFQKALLKVLEEQMTGKKGFRCPNKISNIIRRNINDILGCNFYIDKVDDSRPYILTNGKLATLDQFIEQLDLIDVPILEKLYPGLRYTGEMLFDNGRISIKMSDPILNRRQTISFYKAIMECHLNRRLGHDETIDHIDRDLFNNEVSNFKILGRSEHASIDNKRVSVQVTKCKMCSVEFTPNAFGKKIPLCSHKCVNQYKELINSGMSPFEEIEIGQKEHYRIDKTSPASE